MKQITSEDMNEKLSIHSVKEIGFDEIEDKIISNFVDNIQKETNLSKDDIVENIIKTPDFSQGMALFNKDLFSKKFFEEFYDYKVFYSLETEEKHGFVDMNLFFYNENDSFFHRVDMEHLYDLSQDCYIDEDEEVKYEDIGEFKDGEIKQSEKAKYIYEKLKESAMEIDILKSIFEYSNIDSLIEDIELKTISGTSNEVNEKLYNYIPFGVDFHNNGLELKYLDLSNNFFSRFEKQYNKNVSILNSPVGLLGYIDVEENHYEQDTFADYVLKSIGVADKIRNKGFSGKLFNEAFDNLKDSVITRTIKGKDTPQDFTDSLSNKMNNGKHVFIPTQARFNYNYLFPKLNKVSKKEQRKVLKNFLSDIYEYNKNDKKSKGYRSNYEYFDYTKEILEKHNKKIDKVIKKENNKLSY